ncbi:MAG: hypothetical protein LBJ47_00450, partial [Tannerella sp.]|nr:hypothetical protein [Tannerella sp.]
MMNRNEVSKGLRGMPREYAVKAAIMLFLLVFAMPAGACPYCMAPQRHDCAHGRAVADEWERLPYGNVRIGGEIGRRIDATIHNNLEKL